MTGLVVGSGACVWEDLSALVALLHGPWPGVVVAVNDMIAHYPGRVDHAVSLHADKLESWLTERRRRGGNRDLVTWSHPMRHTPAKRTIEQRGAGSSGLLAVWVAFEVGCERVVLCGVPMDGQGHFFDPRPWADAERYAKAWEERRHALTDVRSMSGWTRSLLGAPTREWLEGRS